MNNLTIRQARPGDAAAVSALIAPLLPLLTLEPGGAGAGKFIETMQAPAIARVLADQRYDYQLGYVDDELAGVVAVRDHAHALKGVSSNLGLVRLAAASSEWMRLPEWQLSREWRVRFGVLRERMAQGRAALDARGHRAARDNENS